LRNAPMISPSDNSGGGSTADESFAVVTLVPPGERRVMSLDPPR